MWRDVCDGIFVCGVVWYVVWCVCVCVCVCLFVLNSACCDRKGMILIKSIPGFLCSAFLELVTMFDPKPIPFALLSCPVSKDYTNEGMSSNGHHITDFAFAQNSHFFQWSIGFSCFVTIFSPSTRFTCGVLQTFLNTQLVELYHGEGITVRALKFHYFSSCTKPCFSSLHFSRKSA